MKVPPYTPEQLLNTPYTGATGNWDGQGPRTHHSYSPSTLQSLEACPCYRGKESKHERTIAGSIAHKVTETGEDDNRLSDDDAEAAAECLDFVERRRTLMNEARQREVHKTFLNLNHKTPLTECEKAIHQIVELRESYLPIDDAVFNDDYADPITNASVKETVLATTAGYVDHVMIAHDRKYAEMIDFKFGFWPVEQANNNLQGIAYALGLFRQYPSIQRIKFWFKQPHLDSISDAEFTRDNIDELYLRVQVVVARAREARHKGNFSAARPAVPVCNFCALIGVCPKVAEFACRVGSKFFPLEIPDDITPTAIHTTRDTTLGMRLAGVLAVWAKSFRTQTTDRVLRGDADVPDGYKIESKSSRDVADEVKFKQIALQFVTQEKYDSMLDVPGFGKLEEAVKDKAPRGQKKNAVEDLKKKLEDSGAVVKSPSYAYLKAVADKPDKQPTNEKT